MAEEFALVAEIREDQGKGASRRLRRSGKVPAIIYGAGRAPRSLSFEHKNVIKQLENEAFFSSILNIKVGSKSQAAIVKDIQRHPSTNRVMHIDLQRIVEDEKIRMNVPIHFLNAEEAVGVKQGGGSVSQLRNEVEVTCLPKDLPEYFEIDISDLDLDEMLHLSDITLPEGVEIPELSLGTEHDQAIVSVHVIKAAAVVVDADVVDGEAGTEEAADAGSGDDAEGGGKDE